MLFKVKGKSSDTYFPYGAFGGGSVVYSNILDNLYGSIEFSIGNTSSAYDNGITAFEFLSSLLHMIS
ncbi:hypothetical protein SLE2022_232260 [Rubroshorea leprosula]